MAIVRKTLVSGAKPTQAQLKELEEMDKSPIVFDDDCPEYSKEELANMRKLAMMKREERKKQVLSLRVSQATIEKAKMLGSGYTGILSRMLDLCIDNPEIVKRCL